MCECEWAVLCNCGGCLGQLAYKNLWGLSIGFAELKHRLVIPLLVHFQAEVSGSVKGTSLFFLLQQHQNAHFPGTGSVAVFVLYVHQYPRYPPFSVLSCTFWVMCDILLILHIMSHVLYVTHLAQVVCYILLISHIMSHVLHVIHLACYELCVTLSSSC